MPTADSPSVSEPHRYYPICLDLRGRRCMVVSGGAVAVRKAHSLLECGAQVTVISPDLLPALADSARLGSITHLPRPYQRGDLESAWLCIAATDDPKTNEAVYAEATERGLLVNVVDDPDRCNFIVPAVVRRGSVAVAVSTGGAGPALAKRLRQELEQSIGPEYGELAELMAELRQEVKMWFPSPSDRQAAWQRVLDSGALELLRQGQKDAARERARSCIWSQSD